MNQTALLEAVAAAALAWNRARLRRIEVSKSVLTISLPSTILG